MRFAMLDSDTARFQGACGVAFRLLEPVKTKEGWQLWASNIEPWKAEKYENADIFIREKYDTHQKIFEEMKVITKERIRIYSRYIEFNLVSVSGTFKLIEEVENPLETFYLSEFKTIRIVIAILKWRKNFLMHLIEAYQTNKTKLNSLNLLTWPLAAQY